MDTETGPTRDTSTSDPPVFNTFVPVFLEDGTRVGRAQVVRDNNPAVISIEIDSNSPIPELLKDNLLGFAVITLSGQARELLNQGETDGTAEPEPAPEAPAADELQPAEPGTTPDSNPAAGSDPDASPAGDGSASSDH